MAWRIVAMSLLCLTIPAGVAFAADEDEETPAKPAVPNIYLDLRTIYATIPAGTLGLGFGNTSLSAAFEALAARRSTTLPIGLPAAKSIAVDLPLTVDFNDRVSLYGGVSGSATDRMGDSDNRLFGITAQIAWMPKPAYQVTLRTPLYAVRN